MMDSNGMPDGTAPEEAARTHGSYSPPCYLREVDLAYAGYLAKYMSSSISSMSCSRESVQGSGRSSD